ncbi:acyl carrier protein [Lacticaseibacillus pabuli]|uniref:Acyl carrier protein n=1 Tax=Lacticaseibacillus pabuli TaxID=3025672 RepID=A0ABY7WSI4_9LACO|nr:acyl carrier protein [Lacticaseibacillus sp. KACC 23028]WDF81921.1 acyl carrier protein [Lacticaseibacillus sp. KACC 23028]
MNEQEIFSKIQDIIAEQLDKDKGMVKPETSFKEDLEADSLDVFEIINEIEDEFDVSIDTEQSINTVSDLVKFIEQAA